MLQYKTPQGSVIMDAVTEKALALAQIMKEQKAAAATTKEGGGSDGDSLDGLEHDSDDDDEVRKQQCLCSHF